MNTESLVSVRFFVLHIKHILHLEQWSVIQNLVQHLAQCKKKKKKQQQRNDDAMTALFNLRASEN